MLFTFAHFLPPSPPQQIQASMKLTYLDKAERGTGANRNQVDQFGSTPLMEAEPKRWSPLLRKATNGWNSQKLGGVVD